MVSLFEGQRLGDSREGEEAVSSVHFLYLWLATSLHNLGRERPVVFKP
jgi:hypothetical protein